VFGNSTQTNTTATFSAPGVYTLLLSASDGVHAVANDAVNITVTQNLTLSIARLGTNLSLNWTGGTPPYIVEEAGAMPALTWVPVMTNSASGALLPANGAVRFFRLRSN
jgi:hypothetical protein